MPNRLHISSFVGLTIFVWMIVLWIQGNPVLEMKFLKPFGIVVGSISVVSLLFNKYIWAWKVFKGWYINRPDLRGTWKVELQSSWIDPETNEGIAPIICYATIRQTFSELSFRLLTKESRSKSIAYNIEKEDDGVFKLSAIYRNEPKIELQGTRSEIHHGSLLLEIYGSPVNQMEGHYWTDRATKGSMILSDKKEEIIDTFEKAEKVFSNK